jgi:hypothetical protein
MPDLDEPVNVDLEPEDALRVLLGEERRETDEDESQDDEDGDAESTIG